MVLSIPFEWKQTQNLVNIEVRSQNPLHVFFSPVYIKVNDLANKRFLAIDLTHPIDLDRSSAHQSVGMTVLMLHKLETAMLWPSLMPDFDKTSLALRRKESIAQGEQALLTYALKQKQKKIEAARANDTFLLRLSEKAADDIERKISQNKKLAKEQVFLEPPIVTRTACADKDVGFQPVRASGGTIKVQLSSKAKPGLPLRTSLVD